MDLGIIDDPGDGLEPLDLKKPKRKGTGKKKFQKKTDFGSQKEVTVDESEEDEEIKKGKDLEGKSSCKTSLELGVPLPNNDEETDQELASIMEENPDVTEGDVSAAKALVRLHSSR